MATEMATSRLQSLQFEEWDSQLASALGHHSSALLTPEIPFSSCMEVVRSADVAAVALEGRSSVRLDRHQAPGQAVLWYPLTGWVEEVVNGRGLVAEPGTAMLCLPGDHLLGATTPYLRGVSVVMPASLLGEPCRWQGFPLRHLSPASESVSAIHMAQELVSALRGASPAVDQLVVALADQLMFWRDSVHGHTIRRHPGGVERRRLLSLARDWIDAHLDHPLRIEDLAAALHVSSRTLQYCFCEELGHSPLVEVRRIRFHRLRQRLLTLPVGQESIEAAFLRCGLAYTSATRRHYREWCGETPSQSRARSSPSGTHCC